MACVPAIQSAIEWLGEHFNVPEAPVELDAPVRAPPSTEGAIDATSVNFVVGGQGAEPERKPSGPSNPGNSLRALTKTVSGWFSGDTNRGE